MDEQNIVTLTVDGMDFSGWKSVDITAGIERQARDFNLSITWKWPGSTEVPTRIKSESRCQVRIGADLVLTGFVYATPISYGAKQVSFGVSGRSITSDLIDCSALREPGQWRNQSVKQIVSALAAPYGIRVLDDSVDASVLSDHQVQPGETAFESIDRVLSMSALLSTDNPAGNLVLARPGSGGRTYDALILGENVLSGAASLDFSGVFSSYECLGQRAGSDDSFGVDSSEVQAKVADLRVQRHRLLSVMLSGQVTPAIARRRAEWERDSRMAKALATTYTVQGWRQSNGALWLPNTVVPVKDALIGFSRDMLISEVNYSLSEEGSIARISVAPSEAFEPEVTIERKRKAKKKKSGDQFEYLIPADWESKA